MIVPLIEDMINEKYRRIILGTFRALAVVHLLAKLTTQSDVTLEALEKSIFEFEKLHSVSQIPIFCASESH